MRSWRNWQTRKTKDLVANTMQVQFLSTAPKYTGFCKNICKSPFFLCCCMYNYNTEIMSIR